MQSLVEVVAHHAQQQPERPALFFHDRVITYAQLFQESAHFARGLSALGLEPGDRVALFLETCPEFVVAYLGTHLAGGIVVLVNTQYRQRELSHILNDAGVRFCVTNETGEEALRSLSVPTLSQVIRIDTDALPHGTASLTLPTAEAPAVIGYTSGTTGRAKGALLCQRNLLANVQAVTTAWQWSERDCLLLALPLFHAHGLMVGIHGTLYTGASAVLYRSFRAAEILDRLEQDESITMFFGVPTMYSRLLAEARQRGRVPHPLRLYVSGSAPLSAQLFTEFEQLFGQRILERYGMTETIMNLTNPYDGERRAGTVGKPFPGQEARIVDMKTRAVLPPGEIGEIEVRGPHVFVGYWNLPEATAEVLSADGWFKTGDLGWCSADGYYTITGRARELIISGGYNIYPREVEEVLATHPAIAEVAVFGVPDPDMGEQVVAAVVPKPGATIDEAAIIAFCREQLASYKKPRQVVCVAELPRNALGKVQKHLLAAQWKER
uniref:Long-chain-fatty-acid--CoA ligase n=1 Tax=Thermosporothrix sp. COM3 TaxID=2490863 RepID=A0A455SAV2_9CHLR|nr:long-chain-fatty-acid--CoA ligase [Thermosporothrix sp. COM3]